MTNSLSQYHLTSGVCALHMAGSRNHECCQAAISLKGIESRTLFSSLTVETTRANGGPKGYLKLLQPMGARKVVLYVSHIRETFM